MINNIRIDSRRLVSRINELAKIGETEDNGISRLAFSDEDKQARDLICSWMKKAGMKIHIDEIGNIIGIKEGKEDIAPIMCGSHIDTVISAGKLDGCYGVLAGLEVVDSLNDNHIETQRPVAVTVFSNEEGVRYTPDMMGSLFYAGGLNLKDVLKIKGFDGTVLGKELNRIGYKGNIQCGEIVPHKYLELHVEQGPFLNNENISIGVVEDLLGISWQEVVITGESNHAGTTPLSMRHDAGLVAAKINVFVRDMCLKVGGNQRGTCGMIEFEPNVINVIPSKVKFTIDLRNSDNAVLKKAENELKEYIHEISNKEGVCVEMKQLVRFDPVVFDSSLIGLIENIANESGFSNRRMTSGAGHDAQMMSRICPSAMIFVPSKNGISHNPKEFTKTKDLEAGANVLLQSILQLSNK